MYLRVWANILNLAVRRQEWSRSLAGRWSAMVTGQQLAGSPGYFTDRVVSFEVGSRDCQELPLPFCWSEIWGFCGAVRICGQVIVFRRLKGTLYPRIQCLTVQSLMLMALRFFETSEKGWHNFTSQNILLLSHIFIVIVHHIWKNRGSWPRWGGNTHTVLVEFEKVQNGYDRGYFTATFNIHKLYGLPTQCIYVFCVDLRTNSDYFTVQH
jgi:hypothetical protein